MLIECHHCEARVDAKVLGQVESYLPEETFPTRLTLLQCPVCHEGIVAGEEKVQTGEDRFEWTPPVRVWPEPRQHVDWSIPPIVRVSLGEAEVCFRAKAYSACAVMCGRALEGIISHFQTKNNTLAAGLAELRDNKIIDNRLFEWGDELRKVRNLGAHASDKTIPREDAKDVLDFTNAICDYVFVLASRFQRFVKRKDSLPAAQHL